MTKTFKDYLAEADPKDLGPMNDKMRSALSKVHSDDEAEKQAARDRAEQDRQEKAKELGPQAMDDYVAKLKAHDWTYQYSDDHRAYTKGSQESNEIRRLGDILDPDRKIYNKYNPFAKESVEEDQDNKGFTDKQIKMAYGVLNDPRYKGGNMTGAVSTIEKIAKGLSKHPGVQKALQRTNESTLTFSESEIDRIKDLSGITEETYDGDDFYEAYGDLWYNEDDVVDEAEYQGRKVKLGKPMRGDVKKFKVYVKDPKTGNVKKVNFGDPNMKIKKSNPARRKSFRARHNCDNPGPRTKARYWSCRKW